MPALGAGKHRFRDQLCTLLHHRHTVTSAHVASTTKAQPSRISEGLCDRRLARSRNTHDHEDGSNASDVSAGGLDHVLVGCRLGGPGSTIAHSNHRRSTSLPFAAASSRNQHNSPQFALWRPASSIASTGACDYWMFSPRRPQGKRQLCWVLRDGLTGVFNHHHDAPRKTCSYTEEANANRLVNIFCSRRSLTPASPPA